jgi:hypothetical protein
VPEAAAVSADGRAQAAAAVFVDGRGEGRKEGDGNVGNGDIHTLPLIHRLAGDLPIPDPNQMGMNLGNGFEYPTTGLPISKYVLRIISL